MKLTAYFIILLTGLLLPFACSKTGGIPPPPPPDPCSLVTISLNGTVYNPSVSGAADGKIILTASGGTHFTYSMNGGAFQSSAQFISLKAGTYTILARSAEGCFASLPFTLTDPVVSCTSVNIVVTVSTTNNIPCEQNTAALTGNASGGTGPYQYSVDGGAFQSSGYFHALATGSHTMIARDANGCTGTASATVGNQVAGPQFLAVRTVIQNYCLYCHSNANPSGGISYSADCNIVTNKLRIKSRAIDGNPSPMPQSGLMPLVQRQKIIDWLNGGGTFSN